MEKINTEIFVSSLFAVGFDRVDALLYTYTLGKLSIDNYKLQMFEFEDSETSQIFDEFVDYDGITFKLKGELSLDSNVSPVENQEWPLVKALHTNRDLIQYFTNLDFREIMLKKIAALDIKTIDEVSDIFCKKEKEIIYQLFVLEDMNRLDGFNHSVIDERLSYQESSNIVRRIK